MLHPRRGIVTEVRQGHRDGRVNRGKQPQHDNGEKTADREQDQNTSGMNDGAHKQEQTE